MIQFEGPDTIAAVLLESVPGTAGIIIPPKDYFKGVREITKKYSILMITDEVMAAIEECNPLAPLHNPAGILGIEAARKVFGNIPMVAVFDTAFHSTMPPKAYMYAIPYEYYEKYLSLIHI